MSTSKRIYLIKASGTLVNCSRGIADYELDTVEKTLLNTIVGTRIPYRRLEVEYQKLGAGPRQSYQYGKANTLVMFVADSYAAGDTLLAVYRILEADTRGMVFVVTDVHGTVGVFKSVKSAFAAKDANLPGASLVRIHALEE